MAIIAILAGLLLPTLGKAKAKDQAAGYTTNLRQASLALNLHLTECGKNAKWVAHRPEVMMRWNRDNLPHTNIWTMNLLEIDP